MDNFIPTHHTCADSFKVGIIVACVMLLLLLLATLGLIFVRKNASANEVISDVFPRPDPDGVKKEEGCE